jgi:hypothetical protein
MTDKSAYPLPGLVRDYLVGGIGLLLALDLLIGAPPGERLFWLFAGLALLFLVILLHAGNRHLTRIRLTERELVIADWRRRLLAWDELTGLSLRYYGVRSIFGRSKGGWMVLRLRSPQGALSVDSDLTGFADIVTRATRAAAEKGLPLDDYTRHNLAAMSARDQARGS